jgi:hypothetical protein
MPSKRTAQTSLSAISDTFANLASRSEAFDSIVQQLVEQNTQLKADLAAAQQQLAKLTGDDDGGEPENDDRSFGTHVSQAWSTLRGK